MTAPAPRHRDKHSAFLWAAGGSLLGVAAGVGLTWSFAAPTATVSAAADLEARVAALDRRIEEIERLRERGGEATLGSRAARVIAGGVDPDLLAHLVEEQLRIRGLVPANDAPSPVSRSQMTADQALLLLSETPATGDRSAAWARIRKEGRLDDVVAHLARRVAEDPRNPDAQVELGLAYVQKMLAMPEGPERTHVGELIDAAFTAALEVDPNHWHARFRKAEGLSYWPPLSGKSGEAIRHFETLVSQQDSTSPRPEQARTYLYLGNLYERQGQPDRAAAIWAKGSQRHPGDLELQQKLQGRRR